MELIEVVPTSGLTGLMTGQAYGVGRNTPLSKRGFFMNPAVSLYEAILDSLSKKTEGSSKTGHNKHSDHERAKPPVR